MDKTFHHVTLSVRNLDSSQWFYERLGFQQVHRWDADDASLSIVHMKSGYVFLELFAYAKNTSAAPRELEAGNNLPEIGIKHIGLRVADIQACLNEMLAAGYEIDKPEVRQGRTKIDYFFIKDPDGLWIEMVQDDRGY